MRTCLFPVLVLSACTPPQVDEVKPTGKVVAASFFGYDAADATTCLQRAFESGVRTIRVERKDSPWIVRPLFITNSNIRVVFADGVVLRAKHGAFRGLGDSLLTIAGGATNVMVCGEGKVLLEMNKRDYMDRSRYAFSEWRHALAIGRSADVVVHNLELSSSGGDGVYIRDATNVTLENLMCRDHYRQGISVISVDGLTVRKCRFTRTNGTAPQCGVDFEPNNTKNIFRNILFEDCLFDENTSSGINLSLYLDETSCPVSFVFRRCRSIGNRGAGIAIGTRSVGGTVLFEDCLVAGSGNVPLVVRNLRCETLKVRFNRCVFDDADSTREPILFENIALPADGGGLRMDEVEVRTNAKSPCRFIHMPGAGMRDAVGKLKIVNAKKQTSNFDIQSFAASFQRDPAALKAVEVAPCDLAKMRPLKEGKRGPRATPWLRGRASVVCFADEPGRMSLTVERKAVGCFSANRPLSVVVFDAVGTEMLTRKLKAELEVLSFDVPRRGVYRVAFGGVECKMRLSWDLPHVGLLADAGVHVFTGRELGFFFAVPKTAKRVELFVNREEDADVVVLDAAGSVRAKLDYARGGAPVRVVRKESVGSEIWRVRFPRVLEDCTFRVGADAFPVVFMTEDDVLVEDGER